MGPVSVNPRWQYDVAIGAVTVFAIGFNPSIGGAILVAALASMLGAIVFKAYRTRLVCFSNGLVWGSLLALIGCLVTNDFSVRYVWLYSETELPVHLKVANVFGGDEGTLLWLAAYLCMSARFNATARGAVAPICAALAAWYLGAVAILNPFVITPPELLSEANGLGMNVHLNKIWMAFHPPLVLSAYAMILSLVAPSLHVLLDRPTVPLSSTLRNAGIAWLILSAGLGFGMVWAFEDAAYGQFWHWDPVQTSVFIVWCGLTTYLHVLHQKHYAVWGRFAACVALATAIFVLFALALTRNSVLVSSHRYVGETSWYWHFGLALVIGISIPIALVTRWYSRPSITAHLFEKRPSISGTRSYVFVLCWVLLICCGLIAIYGIVEALWRELNGIPKPPALMPFYETLRAWSGPSSHSEIARAFGQWDVDGSQLLNWVTLPSTVLSMAGGWFFARRLSSKFATYFLAATFLSTVGVYFYGGYLTQTYRGAGLLSQRVVDVLPLLDVLLTSGFSLAASCLIWVSTACWHAKSWRVAHQIIPIGLIHAGFVAVVVGGTVGSVLNSYSQRVDGPDGVAKSWRQLGDGYEYRVIESTSTVENRAHNKRGFRQDATIELKVPTQTVLMSGPVYLDERTYPREYSGPVRTICELVDYRFARFAGNPQYVYNPLVKHSWSQDIQVWFASHDAASAGGSSKTETVVVIKVFRLASILWLGLIMCSVGAAWLSLVRFARFIK